MCIIHFTVKLTVSTMNAKALPHKETGLLRGDATRIAKRHKISVTHVIEVAKGERKGRPSLMEAIRRAQAAAGQVAA